MRVVICEAGIGNVRSVVRAVERVTTGHSAPGGVQLTISGSPSDIERADVVVVPGQGAFGSFTQAMAGGLGDALVAHIERGRPYLGICLGMQVLFEESDEAPGKRGLGFFRGAVKRLEPGVDARTGASLPLPHIGWNSVTPTEHEAGAMFRARTGLPASSPQSDVAHFYFAHSYAVVPTDPSLVCATTEYGTTFVSAVAKDNVLGVQFHPEKSQAEGLALLATFFRR